MFLIKLCPVLRRNKQKLNGQKKRGKLYYITMFERSAHSGDLRKTHIGQRITLAGWVNRRRDHGGVIFIDLRDREGYVQVVCDPDRAEMFKTAEDVRNEF